jgi:small subunit ribosomal protein S6
MLDPEVPDGDRDRIAAEARQRIEAGGSLKHDSAWGTRKMAYEIRQRTEADYRLFRFQTEGPLLNELDHNLKIVDGVLRFRIFKVDPRAPMIVPPAPTPAAASAPRRDRRDDEAAPAAEGESPEPPAPEPASPPGDAPPPAEEPPSAPPDAATPEPEPAAEEPEPAAEQEPAAPAEPPPDADTGPDEAPGEPKPS